MKITAIYDNGGKTIDRYTVITDEPYNRWENQPEIVTALSLNEGGDGFSQWGAAKAGRHLGKRVQYENLTEETQRHIAQRVHGF